MRGKEGEQGRKERDRKMKLKGEKGRREMEGGKREPEEREWVCERDGERDKRER